jgi:hypothetical protein
MGKYDDVIAHLAAAPVTDLKYQEKIDAAKLELTVDRETGEIQTRTPEALVAAYAALRAEDARLDAARYGLQVQITALEQLIVASWDADAEGWGTYGAGPNTVKLRDGTACDVEQVPEGKVDDPEKFRQWCIANGLEHKLQLWPSTMNAIAKERTLAGAPPPDGVSVYARTKIRLRRA